MDMGKSVIVESPAKAKTIEKFLGKITRLNLVLDTLGTCQEHHKDFEPKGHRHSGKTLKGKVWLASDQKTRRRP